MKRNAGQKVILAATPEKCPACGASPLQRRRRSRIERMLGRVAKYQCRRCDIIIFVTAEDTPEPSE